MAEKKYYQVSWADFYRDAKALAWRLNGKKKWKGMVAITRGGLVPAAIISRELDLKWIDTVCIASYDKSDAQKEAEVFKAISEAEESENIIVIDDLVDTGKTLEIVRKMLPQAHYAAIYAKPAGQPMIDTFVTEVSQDTWIVFPWEKES